MYVILFTTIVVIVDALVENDQTSHIMQDCVHDETLRNNDSSHNCVYEKNDETNHIVESCVYDNNYEENNYGNNNG